MTTVSVCATACFLSASQPVSNAAATACPLSVARRSRSPGGRSLLSTCLRTGLESAAAGGDRAVCLPPAAESLVLRVATQPALGSAAPQLRAPRAPRRHALALKAKLQRLARAERRAAASGPRASQATRRQPVSRFRSTQVRTVRQMSYNRAWRPKAKVRGFEKFQTSPARSTRQPHGSEATAVQKTPADAAVERTWNCIAADVKDIRAARHRRALAGSHDV